MWPPWEAVDTSHGCSKPFTEPTRSQPEALLLKLIKNACDL